MLQSRQVRPALNTESGRRLEAMTSAIIDMPREGSVLSANPRTKLMVGSCKRCARRLYGYALRESNLFCLLRHARSLVKHAESVGQNRAWKKSGQCSATWWGELVTCLAANTRLPLQQNPVVCPNDREQQTLRGGERAEILPHAPIDRLLQGGAAYKNAR